MTADLSLLTESFRPRAVEFLADLQGQGYVFVPYFTVRTVDEQMKLWRQSRSKAEIDAKAKRLEDEGAPYLASRLRAVGAQNGKHVTNAVGGLSWHQWGRAIDCYLEVNGKAVWEGAGWDAYVKTATKHGLTCGAAWGDKNHVQDMALSSPRSLYSMAEIDKEMQKLYGG